MGSMVVSPLITCSNVFLYLLVYFYCRSSFYAADYCCSLLACHDFLPMTTSNLLLAYFPVLAFAGIMIAGAIWQVFNNPYKGR